MINFKDLNTFYDALENKYYKLNRNDFVNIKIDNVIAYASEEKNFGNVVDMTNQKNSYLPFERCLLYGKFIEPSLPEIMIYFLCFRIKKDNCEYINAKNVIAETGKIVTEFDAEDVGLYHGKHGIQLIDMFIAKENSPLVYAGGKVETFYNDYKRMNSFSMSDKDSNVNLSETEESSMFVHYYTSLEFFHCKNVKIVSQPVPDRLKKSQIKKHGRAKLDSNIIKVYPYVFSKDKSKREISFDDFTMKNNTYFTRGHFRTYTEQAKLFGRFTGTFFISPHWRGKHSDETPKDYELITNSKDL